MEMYKRLYVFLISLFLLTACKHADPEAAIKNCIDVVYTQPDPYHNKQLDTAVFSRDVFNLLRACRNVEAQDRERILHSAYPTDKPKLIEGEIFVGLYEGYSSYSIENIRVNDAKAIAVLAFRNDAYHTDWKDSILLVQEKGWKVDQVNYGKGGSLKALLKEFVGGE